MKRHAAPGFSLVELIVSIVIISAAVAGVLGVLTITNRASADPMITKQALAIAEAMLEEVQLMPFTYCDPDDPQAATALSASVGATGCTVAAAVENIGPETTAPYGPESRTSGTTPFDNVNDYDGFGMTGVTDINGAAISALSYYKVVVSVAAQQIPAFGAIAAIPATESQLITVTVTWPASGTPQFTVALHGYRVRYAPNALP